MNINYFMQEKANTTTTASSKYTLLTANELVMMLPDFRTVLADLRDKWQVMNQFACCELQYPD
jgi:hypothetical protein